MSREGVVKRPRITLGTEPVKPYELFQQPPLYKQLYPNVLGADRSFVIPIVYNLGTDDETANYELLTLNTSKWPKSYDNKQHKAMYSLISFSIGEQTLPGVDDSSVLNTIPGLVFANNTHKEPYGLAVKVAGPQTAETQEGLFPNAGRIINSPHILATFPPLSQCIMQTSTQENTVDVTDVEVSSNVVKIYTAQPHLFGVGTFVVTSGITADSSNAAFNGGHVITAVTDTTFSYSATTSDLTKTTSGPGTAKGLPLGRSYMYKPLYHNYNVGEAAFFYTYPPPNLIQMAIPKLDDLADFMKISGSTTIAMRFMVTLLD